METRRKRMAAGDEKADRDPQPLNSKSLGRQNETALLAPCAHACRCVEGVQRCWFSRSGC